MVAPPLNALNGVHWARDGPKFACRVDGCDASYTANYNLVRHLHAHHNVVMEPGNPKHPSTWEEGERNQNHVAMNVLVLSNPWAWFHRNEQKAIVRAKKHTLVEWDRLQVYLQYTHEVPKPTLTKLVFSHILQLFGMITWGVGSISFNVQAKLKHDEKPWRCHLRESS